MRYANLLVAQYEQLGYSISDELNNGLPERNQLAEFQRYLKRLHPTLRPRFPSKLPQSLLQLYSWHNGGGYFDPYFEFLPFDAALSCWEIADESAQDSVMHKNGNEVFSDTSPFPIMATAGGDYIVMDVGETSRVRGSIGRLSTTGTTSVRNEYNTLSRFFRAHYQCCKDGVYTLGEHGIEYDGPRTTLQRFRSPYLQTMNGASPGW